MPTWSLLEADRSAAGISGTRTKREARDPACGAQGSGPSLPRGGLDAWLKYRTVTDRTALDQKGRTRVPASGGGPESGLYGSHLVSISTSRMRTTKAPVMPPCQSRALASKG